jgi:SAM-dependent methyltransferase
MIASFDACYYARSCGRPYKRDDEWLAFFGGIAEHIAAEIGPRRVLDAGCALGLLVETLRDRHIDAFGIDISAFAIDNVHEPVKPFCRQGSVSEPLGDRYDLIVSIEVLEHMEAAEAETAIANFCAHTHDVLFSSSPSDFREATHFNVQPPEYWAGQFARHGFYRDLDFDASFITPWAVRFRHRTDPPHRIVADYERSLSQLVIERNELRSQAVLTQAEISAISKARDEADARAGAAHAALETAQAAREAAAHAALEARAAREASTRELHEARAALSHTRETVEMMRRSWFWRARRPWAWLSRRIGRPT